MQKISVVVPVYNEEEVIEITYGRLKDVMDTCGYEYELIFVNDGSKDKSALILSKICETDKNVKLINFSRNFGHQPAITAGMEFSTGDAVIIIDADLQDPPEVMLQMIAKWQEGYDVVYGKRLKREGETYFKKFSAKIYYRILKSLSPIDIPVDTGDFRLIDRKVCDALKLLPEKNRYVRGMISWVGFNQTYVEYDRQERYLGETKYPLKKMIKLAMDGITSFSYKPLRLATSLGFFISFLSLVYLCYVIYLKLFTTSTNVGWASTVVILLFTQGVVLIVLGLMGEYIGRIYEEVKDRPIYLVNETINFDDDSTKENSNS